MADLSAAIEELNSNPNVIRNEDGSVTLKLNYPVSPPAGSKAGTTVSEINIRRPKPKDIQATSKIQDETSKALRMMELLTGLQQSLLQEMDLAEFTTTTLVVAEMSGKSRGTGPTS